MKRHVNFIGGDWLPMQSVKNNTDDIGKTTRQRWEWYETIVSVFFLSTWTLIKATNYTVLCVWTVKKPINTLFYEHWMLYRMWHIIQTLLFIMCEYYTRDRVCHVAYCHIVLPLNNISQFLYFVSKWRQVKAGKRMSTTTSWWLLLMVSTECEYLIVIDYKCEHIKATEQHNKRKVRQSKKRTKKKYIYICSNCEQLIKATDIWLDRNGKQVLAQVQILAVSSVFFFFFFFVFLWVYN